MPHPFARSLALAVLFSLLSAHAAAQTPPAAEQGSFVLHKFAQAIGKESYTISNDQGRLLLRSDFSFKDRGTEVPLKTEFTAADATHPLTLKSDGQSSRESPMHDSFTLDAKSGKVTLLRAGKTTQHPVTDNTFLVDGYSPVAMQQMLLRYWLAKGKPARIAVPPDGQVSIQPAGALEIQAHGKPVKLQGYVISGLVWGNETAWLDEQQKLAAVVTTDSEFDHFEAVREGYEDSLPAFIQHAADNNLQALAGLTEKAKRPASKKLVVTHVTLIDGTGAAARRNASVYVEDGRIARIDTSGAAPPAEPGLDVLDGSGKFLIPGLWDMHAHYEQVEWGPIYLAAGVTTVRDCGNEFDFITTVRDAIQSGRGIGPRLLIAGIVDGSGPIALGAITADTPEQARAVVRRYKEAGAIQIKIYSSMKPELVPVIAAEAHKLGLTVTGHVPQGMTSAQAVEAGYDSINHIHFVMRDLLGVQRGQPLPPLDFKTPGARRQLALFKQHHTVFDDTIALFELFDRPSTMPLRSIEPGIDHVAAPLAAALNATGAAPEHTEDSIKRYQYMLATLRELHRQGLTIVAGTDQGIPGYSLHRELEIYVQAGFTPMEALQAATSVPAKVLGLDKEVGTLQVGKRADMLLLDADPLADIHNTRRIAKTIANGSVYDPAPLWESVGFKP
ncbi:imidazolonepropionase-like amidohydrolase [Dyella sp. SG562]|uniref:amidohydrolase family protein n=1 Tax=Dyella sp. SG562 TaxID=2587017 RepID=UPI0014241CC9|nr:amidohydrolase family protein [Dyella sp. SG562]NII73970.1 imidazolonepropionase-like amidohydrolase [Dyella sp. SG562]